MAKLIPLGNNSGNDHRPSDEELNQVFGALMDAFFGGLSDEDLEEDSDADIIPFDEFDDSDYWDDLYEGPTPFAYSARPSSNKRRKARKKPTDRQVPNYAYKPRGKEPGKYYRQKIEAIHKWKVTGVNDINYALRIYEGWLAQAEKYNQAADFYYSACIMGMLLWEVSRFHSKWHLDYPKQLPRIRKLERQISEAYYPVLKHYAEKKDEWVEFELKDLYCLNEEFLIYSDDLAGFKMPDFIERVLALLPSDKQQEYRKQHPSKEEILKAGFPISLPEKIAYPDGISDFDKCLEVDNILSDVPKEQYFSLFQSLHNLLRDNGKKLKSYKIVAADTLTKADEEYERLILHPDKDDWERIQKYGAIWTTLAVKNVLSDYRFTSQSSAAKKKFVIELGDTILDLVWRDWDSKNQKEDIKGLEDKIELEKKNRELRDLAIDEMAAYLEKLSQEQHASFHEQALKIIKKSEKKLTDSFIVYKYDIDQFYEPMVNVLRQTDGIKEKLEGDVRKTTNKLFLVIYKKLHDYLITPHYIGDQKEEQKLVKKVVGEIEKLKQSFDE